MDKERSNWEVHTGRIKKRHRRDDRKETEILGDEGLFAPAGSVVGLAVHIRRYSNRDRNETNDNSSTPTSQLPTPKFKRTHRNNPSRSRSNSTDCSTPHSGNWRH